MACVLLMGKETFTTGSLIKIGDLLPPSTICTPRLEEVQLKDLGGPLLLNIFPSIDTSVCAKSMKAFCEQARSLTGLKLFHISKDLPFALDRFVKEHKLDAAVGSAFRSDLGEKLGLTISSGPLRGLLARCVILLDASSHVRYIELVEEISQEPNYRAAIEAAIDLC